MLQKCFMYEIINFFLDRITTKTDISQPGDKFISMDAAEDIKPPYHVKNHLPAGLLPDKIWTVKPKIVYVGKIFRSLCV